MLKKLLTFQINFSGKLLVKFCTRLTGGCSIIYYTFVLFLSRWIEIEIKIVIVYRRAIIEGCSENIFCLPDLHDMLLVRHDKLLVLCFPAILALLHFVLILSQWLKLKSNRLYSS